MSTDAIRTKFSRALSDMYRKEVPQYGTLLELVVEANAAVLAKDTALAASFERNGEPKRLDLERHGAIRLGTARELRTIARVFRAMGMVAVGYYDLSATGVPVHATAFRPVEEAALRNNPFRVFTSLLRLELVRDETLRGAAVDILAQRQIFSPALLDLLDKHDQQNGLREAEAERFVAEALETFRWHSTATVSKQAYRDLHHAHRLVADVVCFRGPHINHLTPRTLDIDFVQAAMPARGISAKAIIEGPPHRRCPILLRQTSFKAVEEPILFEGQIVEAGAHTARFGEIEQRGVALTPKGRALYDRLLAEAQASTEGLGAVAYSARLAKIFESFPDSHDELRRQGLAFYRYAAADPRNVRDDARDDSVDDLIEAGALGFEPIIYEDFLPISAGGIFQSNLGDGGPRQSYSGGSREQFEAALAGTMLDEMELYAQMERDSLQLSLAMLGIGVDAPCK